MTIQKKQIIKRWNVEAGKPLESPVDIEAFLDAYEKLCIKHGLCISHEFASGCFLMEEYCDNFVKNVRRSVDNRRFNS
jgi:hypothetical protein